MSQFSFVILYVADMRASIDFYSKILGAGPVDDAPTFSVFHLGNGVMLGLWQRDGVVPPVEATGGATEVAFTLSDETALQETHTRWAGFAPIAQPPEVMGFGLTFTALDPDGHRVRALVPAK